MYNNFTFEYPYFLLLIVLFIICSIYCKAKTPTYLIPHLNIFKFANQKSMIFINSLKYLVIIFSILALASPVKINDTILLKNDGVNILLNLDASGSMKERDLDENYSKNRFEVVKDIVKDFMDKRVTDNIGMLFFGNLLKESGKTTRLAKTAGNALNDIVVMLLGLTVGCSTQASEFLTSNTIKIFFLGAMAFIIATSSGVLFVKFMNIFLPKSKKMNPLIGNAGVSAVPMSARISNNLGLEYDRHNFLLMHAMGPNVAGVIGSAVAAGALLGFLS